MSSRTRTGAAGLLAAAALLLVLAAVPPGVGRAATAAVVDQVGPGPYSNIVDAFNASDHEAQTFVAGKSGLLQRVDMPIFLVDPAAGDLVVTITGQTPTGLPDPANTL